MKPLRQNLFWVGVALAVAVLLGLYVVLVVPQYARKSRLQNLVSGRGGILSKLDGPVPGDPDIEAWNAYKNRLKKEYGEIVGFYEGCDAHLERWFEGLPSEPGRDAFMARYRDEAQAIEKKLQEKGVKIGMEVEEERKEKARGGFNWEEPSLDDWDKINQVPGDLLRALKTLQKRFWLRKRVADVVLEGNVKVSRVVDFRFLRRLNERIQNAPWEAIPMGSPVPPFASGGGAPSEFELPDKLGQTITFRFGVELPFSEVPRFIQEFLNPAGQAGARQRLLLSLPQGHMTIRSQNDPEKTISYEEGNLEQKRQEEEKVRPLIAPRDVLLVLTCQVLDFDPAKAKKFEDAQP